MSKVDFVIAKTHQAWFDNLKMRDCKEVIFWTPSDWKIRENLSGKPWYFIKKGSVPALMGVGKFRSYSTYTVYVAWEKYSTKLGVDSLDEFMKVIGRTNTTVQIGCIELYDVEYWDDSDQLLYSKGKYLQKFKYCEASELGVAGYSSVLDMSDNFKLIKLSKKEQKNVNSVLRLGQVAFKKRLIREYGCCCVTGECQKELLEAAHIQPYMSEKSHHIQNGLLLRCDIHKLFDAGLLLIDENYCIRLSPKLKSPNYDVYKDKKISLPSNVKCYPSLEALRERQSKFNEASLSLSGISSSY